MESLCVISNVTGAKFSYEEVGIDEIDLDFT